MLKWGAVLGAVCWGGLVCAADQPVYAPAPDWVKPPPVSTAPAPSGAAIQVLLHDRQIRFEPDADEFYGESVVRILSPAGLDFASAIAPSWDPQTETLTFHRFNLLRGGQVIDLLAGGKKVTVVRREKNLELAMLDGDLTATIQPEGLQVGDVLDIAATLTRRDPVLQGHSQDLEGMPLGGVVHQMRIRVLWPRSKPIVWRATAGLPAPKVTQSAEQTELEFEATDYSAVKPPNGAPRRFADLNELEFSQFRNWADVSALMWPLYDKADTLAATSPLKEQARKIAAQSADPKFRAEAALRLTQDQVRYTFLGMNLGGWVPADADVTWQRRFGDCKGKSVVLLALLHELGIEAEPVLVSTGLGDGLDQRRPMLVFDHVIVRARIDGKSYWLDGTRTGDRALDDIAVPDFRWVLPVRRSGASLERLTSSALEEPAFESLVRLDASKGLDAPAPARMEQVFRGDAAVTWNLSLNELGKDEANRSLRDYWRGQYPWVEINDVAFAFDDTRRVMRLTMDGSAKMEWTNSGGIRDYNVGDSSLGFDPDFSRETGVGADAPYEVPYPIYRKRTDIITLPQRGAGFGLLNAADVDQVVAQRRYLRHTRIQDGVVTMVASEQTLAPEISAAEANADAPALRRLSDFDVDVRAASATASDAETSDDDLPTPTDAEGFDSLGASYLLKRDYAQAIAAFDQAVKLDPTSSKYAYNRGVAHFENHQDDLALADFSQALSLNAKDELALFGRAQIYLRRGDDGRARQDLDAAAEAAPKDPYLLLREARIYETTGRYELAVRVYDRLISSGPTTALYNNRCWVRAEWGHELDAALADCDAALKLKPGVAGVLDSRGLVDLRLGRFDEAIKDYDSALQTAPSQAASLFGRGLAELRKGSKGPGDADIAAAKEIQPNIADSFARFGVRP